VTMKRIAIVGNYLPRQCGIATFSTDLCEAIAGATPEVNCFAIPVNDIEGGYDYPSRVRFELTENDLASYRQAADFLNINKVDAVCIQHEFGIYGGPAGSHVLSLMSELRTPIITTLHTIPREPNPIQRQVLLEVVKRSDRVVAMTRKGAEFLREIYAVPEAKIDLIPHGIPDVPFTDPNFYKDSFGVEGKLVLLTFGLLGRNKGIEYVIEALPEVLERYPNTMYMIVGATHPNVQRTEGETYRLSLQRLARRLNVENNVIFHNRFVSLEELTEFIGAADIYLTPYLNQDQITSGTLAYALGAGKAVISTPYWHAEELLGEGAGILVPFRSSEAVAQAVLHLLADEADRHAMRKQAYLMCRKMIWTEVAQQYLASIDRATGQRYRGPRVRFAARVLAEKETELPAIKLDYLRRLSDHTGILQHAVGGVPNYFEGYTTDDNARALILMVQLEELGKEWLSPVADLPCRYLGFLWHAFDHQTRRFRNFLGYDRRWREQVGSEDSHGRAMWAVATVLGRSHQEDLYPAAHRLIETALRNVADFQSLRPIAYALLGIHEYLRRYSGDRVVQEMRITLAERLLAAFDRHAAKDWPWFENQLTYANARLPHALLLAGQALNRAPMIRAALDALQWLANIQTAPDGHFKPVGNRGFCRRGQRPARFDQQPLEAHAMVSACIEACHQTGDQAWEIEARRAFEWFLGRNDLGQPLYNPANGGCFDGLGRQGVNANQGAESTLAFLMSLVEMRLVQHVVPTPSRDFECHQSGPALRHTPSRKTVETTGA